MSATFEDHNYCVWCEDDAQSVRAVVRLVNEEDDEELLLCDAQARAVLCQPDLLDWTCFRVRALDE